MIDRIMMKVLHSPTLSEEGSAAIIVVEDTSWNYPLVALLEEVVAVSIVNVIDVLSQSSHAVLMYRSFCTWYSEHGLS